MGLEDDKYNISGDKFTIQADIAYKVIDTVNLAGKLWTRVVYNKKCERAYKEFKESFYALFLISHIYLQITSEGKRKEVEKIFYNLKDDSLPMEMLSLFQEYEFELKKSKLIELGWWEPSFDKKSKQR